MIFNESLRKDLRSQLYVNTAYFCQFSYIDGFLIKKNYYPATLSNVPSMNRDASVSYELYWPYMELFSKKQEELQSLFECGRLIKRNMAVRNRAWW